MNADIEKPMTCLEKYVSQCGTDTYNAKQSRDEVVIDIDIITDDKAQEFLLLIHLLYIKHKPSAIVSGNAILIIPSRNNTYLFLLNSLIV